MAAGPGDLYDLVPPGLAVDDVEDCYRGNPILASKRRLLAMSSRVASANLSGKIRVEFGPRPTSAVDAVCHWLKMFWVHAAWDSAQMVKFQSGRNASETQLVGQAMRLLILESPVAVTGLRSLPEPTGSRISAISLFPQRGRPLLRIHPRPMSKDVTDRLASNVSKLRMGLTRYRGLLTASAKTEATWIRFWNVKLRPMNRVMPRDKANWLSFDMAQFGAVALGYRNLLAATALAQLGSH